MDIRIARGWATTANDSDRAANAGTGPFLFLSYRGGPDSNLSKAASHKLGDRIQLQLNLIGKNAAPVILNGPTIPRLIAMTSRSGYSTWMSVCTSEPPILRASMPSLRQNRGESLVCV